MPIDKVVNEAPVLDVVVTSEETLPDIEIILEEDGSATVEIGEEDSSSVDFYANLAEVVDPDVLGLIRLSLARFLTQTSPLGRTGSRCTPKVWTFLA
jgi:hypothetical protein